MKKGSEPHYLFVNSEDVSQILAGNGIPAEHPQYEFYKNYILDQMKGTFFVSPEEMEQSILNYVPKVASLNMRKTAQPETPQENFYEPGKSDEYPKGPKKPKRRFPFYNYPPDDQGNIINADPSYSNPMEYDTLPGAPPQGPGIFGSLNMRKKYAQLVTKQELLRLYKQEAKGIYDEELEDEIISGFLVGLKEWKQGLWEASDEGDSWFEERISIIDELIEILQQAKTPQEKMIAIDRVINTIHSKGPYINYLVEGGDEAFLEQLGNLYTPPDIESEASLNMRKKADEIEERGINYILEELGKQKFELTDPTDIEIFVGEIASHPPGFAFGPSIHDVNSLILNHMKKFPRSFIENWEIYFAEEYGLKESFSKELATQILGELLEVKPSTEQELELTPLPEFIKKKPELTEETMEASPYAELLRKYTADEIFDIAAGKKTDVTEEEVIQAKEVITRGIVAGKLHMRKKAQIDKQMFFDFYGVSLLSDQYLETNPYAKQYKDTVVQEVKDVYVPLITKMCYSELEKHKNKVYSWWDHWLVEFDIRKVKDLSLEQLARVYNEGDWKREYGGEAWGSIVESLIQLKNTTDTNQLITIIDHINDIQHNTGLMFHDFPKVEKWFSDALEIKAQATPEGLIPYLSTDLQKLVTEDLKLRGQEVVAPEKYVGEEEKRERAENPNTPPEELAELAKDKEFRWEVAGNPSTPPETLAELAKGKDEWTRWRIADNPNTSPETLAELAKDKDREVRQKAKENLNTPSEVEEQLKQTARLNMRKEGKGLKEYIRENIEEQFIIPQQLKLRFGKVAQAEFNYLGDCRNLANNYFDDATEMAQVIESGEEILLEGILSYLPENLKAKISNRLNDFKAEQYKDIAWVHDGNTNIHYFFLLNKVSKLNLKRTAQAEFNIGEEITFDTTRYLGRGKKRAGGVLKGKGVITKKEDDTYSIEIIELTEVARDLKNIFRTGITAEFTLDEIKLEKPKVAPEKEIPVEEPKPKEEIPTFELEKEPSKLPFEFAEEEAPTYELVEGIEKPTEKPDEVEEKEEKPFWKEVVEKAWESFKRPVTKPFGSKLYMKKTASVDEHEYREKEIHQGKVPTYTFVDFQEDLQGEKSILVNCNICQSTLMLTAKEVKAYEYKIEGLPRGWEQEVKLSSSKRAQILPQEKSFINNFVKQFERVHDAEYIYSQLQDKTFLLHLSLHLEDLGVSKTRSDPLAIEIYKQLITDYQFFTSPSFDLLDSTEKEAKMSAKKHRGPIKSILEDIAQDVWTATDLETAKNVIINKVESSKIDEDDKRTIIDTTNKIDNLVELQKYIANSILFYEGMGTKLSMRKTAQGIDPLFESHYYVTKQELKRLYKQEAKGIYDEELMDAIISGFLATLGEMLPVAKKDKWRQKIKEIKELINILEKPTTPQEKMIAIDQVIHIVHSFGQYIDYLIEDGSSSFLDELGNLKISSLNMRKKAEVIVEGSPPGEGSWAMYQGNVYVTYDKNKRHAIWFEELGIPSAGVEYDNIVRGYFVDDRNYIGWYGTGDYNEFYNHLGELKTTLGYPEDSEVGMIDYTTQEIQVLSIRKKAQVSLETLRQFYTDMETEQYNEKRLQYILDEWSKVVEKDKFKGSFRDDILGILGGPGESDAQLVSKIDQVIDILHNINAKFLDYRYDFILGNKEEINDWFDAEERFESRGKEASILSMKKTATVPVPLRMSLDYPHSWPQKKKKDDEKEKKEALKTEADLKSSILSLLLVGTTIPGIADMIGVPQKQVEQTIQSHPEYFEEAEQPELPPLLEHIVTATIYHAVPEQTSADPEFTADMTRIDPDNVPTAEGERIIALSRDLLKKFTPDAPFDYGDKVLVEGAGEMDGLWVVHDTMNARFSNTIDFLVPKDITTGKWENVKINKVQQVEAVLNMRKKAQDISDPNKLSIQELKRFYELEPKGLLDEEFVDDVLSKLIYGMQKEKERVLEDPEIGNYPKKDFVAVVEFYINELEKIAAKSLNEKIIEIDQTIHALHLSHGLGVFQGDFGEIWNTIEFIGEKESLGNSLNMRKKATNVSVPTPSDSLHEQQGEQNSWHTYFQGKDRWISREPDQGFDVDFPSKERIKRSPWPFDDTTPTSPMMASLSMRKKARIDEQMFFDFYGVSLLSDQYLEVNPYAKEYKDMIVLQMREAYIPLITKMCYSELEKHTDELRDWKKWEKKFNIENLKDLTLEQLVQIYNKGKWKSEYGGSAWGGIVESLIQLKNTTDTNQLITIIDHINDIQHNTGLMFHDVPRVRQWFGNALDVKARASIEELIPYLSTDLRKLVTEDLKLRGQEVVAPEKYISVVERGAQAGNPSTSPETLTELAKDTDVFVRMCVADNPSTPPEALTELVRDENVTIRRDVAGNPNTPPKALTELVRDTDMDVRWNVADNPSTSPEILTELAKDENKYVRRGVANNPNTPLEIKEQLKQTANLSMRKKAQVSLETLRQFYTDMETEQYNEKRLQYILDEWSNVLDKLTNLYPNLVADEEFKEFKERILSHLTIDPSTSYEPYHLAMKVDGVIDFLHDGYPEFRYEFISGNKEEIDNWFATSEESRGKEASILSMRKKAGDKLTSNDLKRFYDLERKGLLTDEFVDDFISKFIYGMQESIKSDQEKSKIADVKYYTYRIEQAEKSIKTLERAYSLPLNQKIIEVDQMIHLYHLDSMPEFMEESEDPKKVYNVLEDLFYGYQAILDYARTVVNTLKQEKGFIPTVEKVSEKMFDSGFYGGQKVLEKVLGTLIEEGEITQEKEASILDYPQKHLDSAMWDLSGDLPKLKEDVKGLIVERFLNYLREEGKLNNPELWCTGFYYTGSTATYRYRPTTDIDIHVKVDWEKFKKFNPDKAKDDIEEMHKELLQVFWNTLNKEVLPDTQHPLTYYVLSERENVFEMGEEAYDILNDSWIVPPHKLPENLDIDEKIELLGTQANAIMERLDEELGKTKRDFIDYKILKELLGSYEGDKKDIQKLIEKKLDDVEKGLKGLQEENVKIHDERQKAFHDGQEPIEEGLSQNWAPGNIIFKLIEKYRYMDVLRKIKHIIEDDKITEEEEKQLEDILEPKLSMRKVLKFGQEEEPPFPEPQVTKQELITLYKKEAQGIYDEEAIDAVVSEFIRVLEEMILYGEWRKEEEVEDEELLSYKLNIKQVEDEKNLLQILQRAKTSQEKMIAIDQVIHIAHEEGVYGEYLVRDYSYEKDEEFFDELSNLKISNLNMRKTAISDMEVPENWMVQDKTDKKLRRTNPPRHDKNDSIVEHNIDPRIDMASLSMRKKAQLDLVYLGDCRDLANNYFDDATEMAQLIENSEEILLGEVFPYLIEEDLKEKIQKRPKDFYAAYYKNIVWVYDDYTDLHYFYKLPVLIDLKKESFYGQPTDKNYNSPSLLLREDQGPSYPSEPAQAEIPGTADDDSWAETNKLKKNRPTKEKIFPDFQTTYKWPGGEVGQY